MLRIQVQNIQWNNDIIRVAVKTTRQRKRKNRKDDIQKSGTKERKIIDLIIDKHTKELLADYVRDKKLGPVGPLFSISRQRVWQIIKELAKEADLERMDFLSPHKLRHGFGADITRGKHKLFGGIPNLAHVQDQMGHADIRYTRIYLQYTPEDRKEAFGI
jgi:integrase